MQQFLRVVGFCGAILLAAQSSISTASPKRIAVEELEGFSPIELYQLANGLTVVLWPDAGAKSVAFNTWYRVGALHEKEGFTGIAHLFEHMMLRPSRYAPKGGLAFERTMGADIGAATKYRTTEYYMSVMPEKLDEVLRFHSDIMRNVPLNAQMLKNEKEAVRSEYLNWDNSPFLVLLPVLAKNTYPDSIAASFITGERADLDKIQPKDCLDFYRRYYAPNNAVVVLTGKFDPSSTLAKVEKYYAPIPQSEEAVLPEGPQVLPEATLIRHPSPGDSRYMFIGYPVSFRPLPFEEDSAFELGMNILFGGESSIIGQELVLKENLLQSVEYQGFEFPSAILSLAGPTEEKALAAIDKVIEGAQNLDSTQFKKYAFAARSNLIRDLQTPEQRANRLGFYLTHRSGLRALKIDLQADKAISLDNVKAVIKKYFSAKHRVAVVGVPKGDGK